MTGFPFLIAGVGLGRGRTQLLVTTVKNEPTEVTNHKLCL